MDKKILIVLGILSMFTLCCYGQTVHTKSSITDPPIDNNILKRSDDIVLLGKIWGFLKYYHPSITKEKVDWDQELLDVFPIIF